MSQDGVTCHGLSEFRHMIRESLSEKGPNDCCFLLPSCVKQNHKFCMRQGLNKVGLRILTNKYR